MGRIYWSMDEYENAEPNDEPPRRKYRKCDDWDEDILEKEINVADEALDEVDE